MHLPERPTQRLRKLVGTRLEWGNKIFSVHDTGRITNGRIECINNRLGALKRITYGFVNTHNFVAGALLATRRVPAPP